MLHEEIISNVLLYINLKTKWYSYTNNYIMIVLIAMDEHIKWRERERKFLLSDLCGKIAIQPIAGSLLPSFQDYQQYMVHCHWYKIWLSNAS